MRVLFCFVFLFEMVMAPAEYWRFRSCGSGGEMLGTSWVCRGA